MYCILRKGSIKYFNISILVHWNLPILCKFISKRVCLPESIKLSRSFGLIIESFDYFYWLFTISYLSCMFLPSLNCMQLREILFQKYRLSFKILIRNWLCIRYKPLIFPDHRGQNEIFVVLELNKCLRYELHLKLFKLLLLIFNNPGSMMISKCPNKWWILSYIRLNISCKYTRVLGLQIAFKISRMNIEGPYLPHKYGLILISFCFLKWVISIIGLCGYYKKCFFVLKVCLYWGILTFVNFICKWTHNQPHISDFIINLNK